MDEYMLNCVFNIKVDIFLYYIRPNSFMCVAVEDVCFNFEVKSFKRKVTCLLVKFIIVETCVVKQCQK